LIVLQDIKKLALCIFSHHTELSVCFESVEHQNNIFMVQLSKNTNFLTKIPDIFLTFSMLRDEFHGYSKSSIFTPRLHKQKKLSFISFRIIRREKKLCHCFDITCIPYTLFQNFPLLYAQGPNSFPL
jgi:hypothetical protein